MYMRVLARKYLSEGLVPFTVIPIANPEDGEEGKREADAATRSAIDLIQNKYLEFNLAEFYYVDIPITDGIHPIDEEHLQGAKFKRFEESRGRD